MGHCLFKASADNVVELILKYMLGGAFATLAIIKLCELVDQQPRIGIPLVAVMTFAWMVELFRELRKAKR